MRLFLCLALSLAALCARAEDRFFDSAGVRLRYVERGAGPVVILLHGFTGRLERPWVQNGMLDSLSVAYRVVALDLRGHGESGKPHEPEAYLALVPDMVRLLDHLGVERAHIIGYSLGGIIAARVAVEHPQRVASVVLAGAAQRRSSGAAIDEATENDAREIENGPVPYRSLILSTWPSDLRPPTEEAMLARSRQVAEGNDRLAHAALLRARRALVVTDAELADSKVRAMAIIGDLDPALPRVRRMAKTWPGLHLVVVPDATHPVADSRSLAWRAEFARSIRAFLDASASSGSAAASSSPPKPSSSP